MIDFIMNWYGTINIVLGILFLGCVICMSLPGGDNNE